MIRRGSILMAALLFLAAASAVCSAETTSRGAISRGVEYYGAGKWREAILELRKASIEAGSAEERAEALYWIGMAEMGASEYDSAVQDLDAALALDPKGPRSQDSTYQKARAFFHLGRYDAAIVFFKGYADASAESAKKSAATYWIGECLFSLGRMEDAKAVFSTLIEKYPESVKFEAASYRIALIDRKNVETELLKLLKWSHEESLKTVEEYQRRERSYEQAIVAYQKRIAEMLKDTRTADLEKENRSLTASLATLEADLAAARKRAETAEALVVSTKAELEARVAAAAAEATKAAAQAAQAAVPIPPASQGERISRLLAVKAQALDVKEFLLERLGSEKPETENAK